MVSLGGAPNHLELFGARVLAGRGLQPGDANPDASAVVVSRSFVRQVLGGGTAVGRRVRHVVPPAPDGSETPERWHQIVGVVEDLQRNSLRPDTIPPTLYYAVSPAQVEEAQIAVRLRPAGQEGVAGRIRELAIAVDPTLRLGPVHSLADDERQNWIAARLMALAVSLVLLSVFLLSAAGVYALMSFTVTQRRREIGIRAALGAAPSQVLRSVFARAATQIGIGVLVGLGLAALLEFSSGGTMLGGKGGVLLPVFAVSMTVVALLAAFGPARRGLRIEPTEALRAEA